MKVRVILNKQSCVGNEACLKPQSEFIEMIGEKAHIKESIAENGMWQRELDLTNDQIEKLKQAAQLCPTNSIQVINLQTGEELVQTEVTKQQGVKRVQAEYDDEKEFVLDPNGYFLIRTIPENKEIEVGFCDKPNQVKVIVTGKTPLEIYSTILNKLEDSPYISRLDHAAYLGRELQKAYTALRLNIAYVQDDELNVGKE